MRSDRADTIYPDMIAGADVFALEENRCETETATSEEVSEPPERDPISHDLSAPPTSATNSHAQQLNMQEDSSSFARISQARHYRVLQRQPRVLFRGQPVNLLFCPKRAYCVFTGSSIISGGSGYQTQLAEAWRQELIMNMNSGFESGAPKNEAYRPVREGKEKGGFLPRIRGIVRTGKAPAPLPAALVQAAASSWWLLALS